MPAKTVPLIDEKDVQIFQDELKNLDMGYYILFEVARNVPFLISELLTLKVHSVMKANERDLSKSLYCRNRYVRLNPAVLEDMKRYLVQREILWGDNIYQEHLFCSLKKNTVIVGSSFTKSIYRIRQKYNIKTTYGLSSLRKAYAIQLLEILPIEEVAKLYEKDVSTFKNYISY